MMGTGLPLKLQSFESQRIVESVHTERGSVLIARAYMCPSCSHAMDIHVEEYTLNKSDFTAGSCILTYKL